MTSYLLLLLYDLHFLNPIPCSIWGGSCQSYADIGSKLFKDSKLFKTVSVSLIKKTNWQVQGRQAVSFIAVLEPQLESKTLEFALVQTGYTPSAGVFFVCKLHVPEYVQLTALFISAVNCDFLTGS